MDRTVLVAEPIAEDGIVILKESLKVDYIPDLKANRLMEIIGEYDALLVRSGTKVTEEVIGAGKKLKVVGRAGVGVDNIDVAAATRRGVVVVNAPGGNTIAAAEHTIAMMLSLARNIPHADASLRAGKWQRQEFMGREVRNKILGVIGLGKVGVEVVRRAQGMEMRTISFDPFASEDLARHLGVDLVSLEELLRRSDFITVHTPLTEATRSLVGAKEMALMKPTAYVINCARGGIVDEDALLAALQQDKIGGAALDVFTKEPLGQNPFLECKRLILTPHLGAMTHEAQVSVAVDVAHEIVTVLGGGQPRYAVNLPLMLPETLAVLAPFASVAESLGKLATQLVDGQPRLIEMTYSGEISQHDTAPLTASVIKGLLSPISEEQINLVNAMVVARNRGLHIREQKESQCENYNSLVTVTVTASGGKISVSGTSLGGEPHLTQVGGYWLDVPLSKGFLLFGEHLDRPGIIGTVGTLLGAFDVNISFMQVGRHQPRGRAVMILGVDGLISEEVRQQLQAIPDLYSVKTVQL
ncbi:MAG: phosphoglycerate dehydrogenase [Dehalococcoidia bacterium]|nr:phosphoglycerate dehydrogenase [Dehalococcoidia bacterium]